MPKPPSVFTIPYSPIDAGRRQFKYDVCFSFASEQRDYVRQVKDELFKAELSVFFDEEEQVKLWGSFLNETFDNVYRKESRFCVIFISAEYAKKMWTNHERRSVRYRFRGQPSGFCGREILVILVHS